MEDSMKNKIYLTVKKLKHIEYVSTFLIIILLLKYSHRYSGLMFQILWIIVLIKSIISIINYKSIKYNIFDNTEIILYIYRKFIITDKENLIILFRKSHFNQSIYAIVFSILILISYLVKKYGYCLGINILYIALIIMNRTIFCHRMLKQKILIKK
jgi:hypothetical protein